MNQTVFGELGLPFTILGYIGFLPFRISGKGSFKINYTCHKISISLGVVVLIAIFYSMNFVEEPFEGTAFLNTLTLLYLNSMLMKNASALLTSMYFKYQIVYACKDLLRLERDFHSLKINLNYKKIKYISYFYFIVDAAIKYPCFIEGLFSYKRFFNTSGFFYFPAVFASDLTLSLLRMIYIMSFMTIREYFLQLNTVLKNIIGRSFNIRCKNIILALNKSALLHFYISNLTRQLNRIFSIVLLTTFSESFLLLIIHTFNFTSALVKDPVSEVKLKYSHNISIIWVIYSILTVLAMIVPAHMCTVSVSTTQH